MHSEYIEENGEVSPIYLWDLVETVDADGSYNNLTNRGELKSHIDQDVINTINAIAPIKSRPDFMRIEHAMFAMLVSDIHSLVEAEGGLNIDYTETLATAADADAAVIMIGIQVGEALNSKVAIQDSVHLTPNQRLRIARYNVWGGGIATAEKADLYAFQHDSITSFFGMVNLMARSIVMSGIETGLLRKQSIDLELYAKILEHAKFGKIIAESMNTGNGFWGIRTPGSAISLIDFEDEEEYAREITNYWEISGNLTEGRFAVSDEMLQLLNNLKDSQNAGKNPESGYAPGNMPTNGCPLLNVQVPYSTNPSDVTFISEQQLLKLTSGERPLAVVTPRHPNTIFMRFSIVNTLMKYYIDALRAALA
jgi:hypothetical protein